ncbi:unnamed protein product [Kuraishia capsulata CBS 1993]|uniref:Uncharacterized protein n=1 Tax=Kuraishia capsulata CBS 1993 TaxID=1382522 RepID=W6MLB9_9ASCO|nr:uncharacterized protein KUCA_T00002878001 [Kuraishia capsulata CBS 1993]CDK26903.1 unnamed protein product [Kuraishia capsulata CBS 1993]
MESSLDAERLKRLLKSVKANEVGPRILHNSNALALMLAQTPRNQNLDRLAQLMFVSSLVRSSKSFLSQSKSLTRLQRFLAGTASTHSSGASSSLTAVSPKISQKESQGFARPSPLLRDGEHTTVDELLAKYTRAETYVLDNLESAISVLDNFYFLSRMLRLKDSKAFRLVNKVIVQTSKVWMVIILLTMKNLAIRYYRVSKAEVQVKSEVNQLRALSGGDSANGIILGSVTYDSEMKLLKIEAEKLQIVLEIIGNLNELAFCVIEVMGLDVPNFVNNTLGVLSWIMSLYRMSKDGESESGNQEVDAILREYGK